MKLRAIKKLYISLPVGSNATYTHCHCVSRAPMNKNRFFSNLFELKDDLNDLEIDEIKIIGGEPLLYELLEEVLKILSFPRNQKSIITNAIGLNDKINNFNGLLDRIDICRFKIDDFENSNRFENLKAPKIFEIESLVDKAKRNKIDVRLIVPVISSFKEDIIKFIDMSKYLGIKTIVFRKIVENIKNCDFSFDKKLSNFEIFSKTETKLNITYVRNVKGINVLCENIGMETINKRIKNNEFLVYHPNGVLTNNWSGTL